MNERLKENAPGALLAALRKQNGWTLAEVSGRTGVSISTLSKIENGVSAPAYSVLVRLADGLQLDISALLGQPRATFGTGVREVTPAGQGIRYSNDMGGYEDIAAGLSGKAMQPMIIDIPYRDGAAEQVRSEHNGQEYVLVLSGAVVFEMEHYAPTRLGPGDSLYFDSGARHGFSAETAGGARILSVCHVPHPGLPQDPTT
ncbi:helix-turn-helix domain-containing protein [Ketogulonicigenium vulgare]|uniref:Putative transcriptional regulator n=1 Tax=Ketogulonicigenium vulgare (strain WSH-001) TaxID=759362 RepID=F9Y531_KETVW|nr:XRE family transcriptional regulator [Ketogulonicigenium vulgare]ADO42464.1 transcriptional regulator [Ketogulonicigenium vulgare Y25]AEM40663.1 putative transcriptional regulator [Ketogulonicigenium vulgare WSH-001]ALJ80836.1 transcriptional regulator [Ketogulonicigenium vulgare]ANW33615.1 transcriptional regulator [Ketogulonicigenium vulgare]AOZ54377.1 transcriptional regulator [Ketogulonicigenium vulgare]